MSRLLDVPAYALRYWVTEFPGLEPVRGGSGQPLYREHDLRLIRRIRQLLYEDGYTIPGARKKLASEGGNEVTAPEPRRDPPPSARALIRAAGDKAGGAAINLDDAARAARRIEACLDRLRDARARSVETPA